jgi:cytosine/adenosine deaminase-related metal-dependent hydrolase
MVQRTLLRGGIVLTSDRSLGTVWPGDVLIEDDRIAAVGPSIEAGDAEVIDVTGRIVLPGFVDTHRHTWQSIVRNIASDWTLMDYLVGLHSGLSKHFRAQDTYVANLLGALEALDSGITTLLDWSHNLFTPEHADAAIEALRETRMRAVFAHGGGAQQWGAPLPSPVPHPEDARRIRAHHFASNEGLVTMALALRGPQFCTEDTNRGDFRLARDLDLRVTVHVGDGEWGRSRPIKVLERDGLLSDRTTYVHCNTLADDELDIIRDTGGTASVAPDVEMQMGHGWPATGRLLAHGIRPTFSIDVCSSNGGDMFGTMRTAIGAQRATDNHAAVAAMVTVEALTLSCRDVIEFATIDGAVATGLGAITGSLVPGKQADLIVLAGDSLALTPVNNPAGAVVYNAHPGVVEDVMVAGAWRKRHGRLVDVDEARLLRLAIESRDHVFGSYPEGRIGGDWMPRAAVTA